MDLVDILVLLVGGSVIGLLGKFVAPGNRDNIPLWLTVICGIVGVLLGTFLYSQFFTPQTNGVDWWRHVWQIGVAAILVMIAATVTGRSHSRRT